MVLGWVKQSSSRTEHSSLATGAARSATAHLFEPSLCPSSEIGSLIMASPDWPSTPPGPFFQTILLTRRSTGMKPGLVWGKRCLEAASSRLVSNTGLLSKDPHLQRRLERAF